MFSSDVSRETGKGLFPSLYILRLFWQDLVRIAKVSGFFSAQGGDRNPPMSKCVKVATRLDSGNGTRRDIEVGDKVGRNFFEIFEQKGAKMSGKAKK